MGGFGGLTRIWVEETKSTLLLEGRDLARAGMISLEIQEEYQGEDQEQEPAEEGVRRRSCTAERRTVWGLGQVPWQAKSF